MLLLVSKKIFKERKDRSIFLATSLVGNTGNIGIPMGIALFGIESVPYTSIINIGNVFFIYIFSIYFFAREKYSLKEAIISILKIPAIWSAIIALSVNAIGVNLAQNISTALEMGAYASMVIQLLIFGMYLSKIKVKAIPWFLSIQISFVKHIVLPALGLFVLLYFTNVNTYVASILIMQLMVPLAVNNVNLAALYDCNPYNVTASVLISSIVFVVFLYPYVHIIDYFIK